MTTDIGSHPLKWLQKPGYKVTDLHIRTDDMFAYIFTVRPVDINGEAVYNTNKLCISYDVYENGAGFAWTLVLRNANNREQLFIIADRADKVCLVTVNGKTSTARKTCQLWQKRIMPVIKYLRVQYSL